MGASGAGSKPACSGNTRCTHRDGKNCNQDKRDSTQGLQTCVCVGGGARTLPVIDIFAEAERRDLYMPLTVDQAVACC